MSNYPVWLTFRDEVRTSFNPSFTLLRLTGITTPPIDVIKLASLMDVRVLVASMDEQGRLDVTVDKNGAPLATICCKASDTIEKQRFTIAHELGHLFFHDLSVGYRDINIAFKDASLLEDEVNKFAVNLLIPTHMLEITYRLGVRTPESIAQSFVVPLMVANFKLKQ